MDYTVHRILQARILEWIAFPFSRGSSQPRDWTQFSCIAGGFFTGCHEGNPKILEWVAYPFSRDLPDPGIELGSPAFQVDSLPAEPQEKPNNTGVGSLSFLQWIFLTQESNWGLLHSRWILYQLSYQGRSIGGTRVKGVSVPGSMLWTQVAHLTLTIVLSYKYVILLVSISPDNG